MQSPIVHIDAVALGERSTTSMLLVVSNHVLGARDDALILHAPDTLAGDDAGELGTAKSTEPTATGHDSCGRSARRASGSEMH